MPDAAQDWLARRNLPFVTSLDEKHAAVARGLGAMAAVISPEGIVLHLRDDKPCIPHPGLWSLFGGGVEAGEDPQQTIMRELREELSVTVARCRARWLAVDAEGDGRLLTIFEARTAMRMTEMVLAEGQALQAFEVRDALKRDLAPFCRRVLKRLEPG